MAQLSTILRQVLKRERYLVFKGHSRRELQEITSPIFGLNSMDIAEGEALNAEIHKIGLGGLDLIYLHYGANVTLRPKALPHNLLLQIVLAGTAIFEREGRQEVVTEGFAALLEDPERWSIACSTDVEQLIIPLKKCMFAYASEKISGSSAPVKCGLHSIFSLQGDALQHLLSYLIQQVEKDDFLLEALSVPFEITLVHELVANHSVIARQASVSQAAVPACLYRAERYMACNLEKDISLSHLASFTGTHPRTLSHNFQRFRSKSPITTLRDMRLEKIRELLLIGVATSVTDVAMKYRFNHAGRFAAIYHKRFGELPSQTLTRTIGDDALREKSEMVTLG